MAGPLELGRSLTWLWRNRGLAGPLCPERKETALHSCGVQGRPASPGPPPPPPGSWTLELGLGLLLCPAGLEQGSQPLLASSSEL